MCFGIGLAQILYFGLIVANCGQIVYCFCFSLIINISNKYKNRKNSKMNFHVTITQLQQLLIYG